MTLGLPGRSRRLARVLPAWVRGPTADGLSPLGGAPKDDRLQALVRQVLRLGSGFTGQGMLDDHHGVLGQPQGLSPEAGRLGKCLGNDGNRGAAPLFGFNPVVDTRRCAGASVGHRVDDRLAFVGESIITSLGVDRLC